MRVLVAFLSQKGGVGKSTLARALATSVADAKIAYEVADLDSQQATFARWAARRLENQASDPIRVSSFPSVAEALAGAPTKDHLVIVDAPPRASRGTLEIAHAADLVVQPSGPGLDDLDPAILLFHELIRAGVSKQKLVLALTRVATKAEEHLARRYVEAAGYAVLPGAVLERVTVRDAHNHGQSVVEVPNLDESTRALMHGLLGEITERIKRRVLQTAPRKKRTRHAA